LKALLWVGQRAWFSGCIFLSAWGVQEKCNRIPQPPVSPVAEQKISAIESGEFYDTLRDAAVWRPGF